MAVYRNLQEQVFENTKDIEELQQNTNNLELDIVDVQNNIVGVQNNIIDVQNKTQQIQELLNNNIETVNNLESDMVVVQNKTQPIQVSKDEPLYPGGVMYLAMNDGSSNHYGTVISQASNLWMIEMHSESGYTKIIVEPNNLRFTNNNNGKYTEWSITEQISLNEQIKALLNK